MPTGDCPEDRSAAPEEDIAHTNLLSIGKSFLEVYQY
jgi:hypothetical protein